MKTDLKGLLEIQASDYFKISAMNKSGLDQINKSPAHYQDYLRNPVEETDAMTFGSAAHCGIFEPELLYKNFIQCPEGMIRNEKHKAYQDFLAANPGKEVLKSDEFTKIEAMMQAVRKNRLVSRMFSGGRSEVSAVAQDPEFGISIKARVDYMGSEDTLYDFKTAESVQFFPFQRAVRERRYHVQAAWYLDVVNAALGTDQYKKFVLVAMEKKNPYGIIAYELDTDSIRAGRMAARQNLETYVNCLTKNEWPCYPEAVLTMTLPTYE